MAFSLSYILKHNDSFPGRHLIGVLDCQQLTPPNSKNNSPENNVEPVPIGGYGGTAHLVGCCVCVYCVLCFVLQPMTRQLYLFFSGCNFFQFCNNWCSYFDTTDGYLRFHLEEPSGYPAQPGLTWRNPVRVASPHRIMSFLCLSVSLSVCA